MTKAYRISQVYDIAKTFISDRNSHVNIKQTDMAITYRITRTLNRDTVYSLTIVQPIGPVIKPEIGVRDWEVDYKQGTIILSENETGLMLAQTRHGVGQVADKNSSVVSKLLARTKSRKFFEIIDLITQRGHGNLALHNNVAEILNIVYRLKELQK